MTRIAALSVLLLISIGACYGGLGLIIDPSGKSMQLSVDMLQYSPFANYLIPGWILFIVLGLGSLVACAVVLLKTRGYPFLTIFIGFALSIWISIQILMLRTFEWIQVLFGILGIVLIILGILLRKKEYDHPPYLD